MKIAITGANGFVGSNLVMHFSQAGHDVTAIVRKNSSLPLIPSPAKIIKLDYSDTSSLSAALHDAELIIHNAGKTKALNPEDMLAANLGITKQVVAAVNTSKEARRLIYISSQAASRPSVNNLPVNEDEASAPLTSYGRSKVAAENYIRENSRISWTIIRPCSVYGCGDKDFLTLFKSIKHGFSFRIGSKNRLLNMIHISELCAFVELCATHPQAQNQVFFATDGHTYKQSDVMHAIANALHKHPLTITIPECLATLAFRAGDLYGKLVQKEVVVNKEKMKEIMADSWLANPCKAYKLLGWQPIANMEEHIKETASCYQKMGWL